MNGLVSLSMSLALIAPPFVACLHAKPNDEEDVRQVVSSFAETWNRHDMEAFGKLFAPDADFVNVAGDWWKGRQAIQMHHAYSHGTIPADTKGEPLPYYGIFKTSTIRFTQADVRFLGKDVAVAHASWELLGDARTPNPRHGLITFVLTRQEGAWLIAAAQNTEINRTVK
ncbi:MAG: SgcJ/EcaC family oxidoreductase [Terracidiphilus sp.]